MIDEFAKEHLHDHLRWVREAMVWKLDGLSEYDIRRPLTATGTNLLGLVKHLSIGEARYFGDVFGRPFPEPLPSSDDESEFWASEQETRQEILGRYLRAQQHSDATIKALAIDARGHVPWWGEDVMLFNIMVHMLSDTTRHAGQADILREQLDGAVGMDPDSTPLHGRDSTFWQTRCTTIERAARAAADRASTPPPAS
jgi:uncharacterized damage-inducible protein DinB